MPQDQDPREPASQSVDRLATQQDYGFRGLAPDQINAAIDFYWHNRYRSLPVPRRTPTATPKPFQRFRKLQGHRWPAIPGIKVPRHWT
jgi:hypothetical protein